MLKTTTSYEDLRKNFLNAVQVLDWVDIGEDDNGLFVSLYKPELEQAATVFVTLPKDGNGSVEIKSCIKTPERTKSVLRNHVHSYNAMIAASFPGFFESEGNKVTWYRSYTNPEYFNTPEKANQAVLEAVNIFCDFYIMLVIRWCMTQCEELIKKANQIMKEEKI